LNKKYLKKVSCGKNNCLFLTHAGMAFSFGENKFGQLGIGNNVDQKEPVMITSLLNYRITELFSGENHSVAIGCLRESINSKLKSNENLLSNKESFVFTWGDNRFGQLGLGLELGLSYGKGVDLLSEVEKNKANKYLNYNTNSNKELIYCKYNPTILEFFQKKIIKFIEIGQNHNLFLTNDGKIYAFGSNLYNQIMNSRSN
jgi:E3 ubiquitin-protein ligase HERC4